MQILEVHWQKKIGKLVMVSNEVLWFWAKQAQDYLKLVGSLTVDQHQCKLPSKSKKIGA